jgi:hypothetical protein
MNRVGERIVLDVTRSDVVDAVGAIEWSAARHVPLSGNVAVGPNSMLLDP